MSVSASVSRAPADGVLGRLRRVRLREAAAEEEFEEPGVVAPPGVAVVAGPAGVGVELRIEVDVPLGQPLAERDRRAYEHKPADPIGMAIRQDERALRPDGQGDDHRALGAGRVEDRPRVLGELGFVVGVGGPRPIGAPVAPRIEGDHAISSREVWDLHLPEACMDDRPRREQEDGRLAVAVYLVENADAVALDGAGQVRIPSAGLFARPDRRSLRRADRAHQTSATAR